MSVQVADLESWRPGQVDFALPVRLIVGPEGCVGEESFDLTVCTAGWLLDLARRDGVVDGRHCLIVETFDYRTILAYVTKRVSACDGETWEEVASKLSRLGHWEFEDYSPSRSST
jgi:hypothetical protein